MTDSDTESDAFLYHTRRQDARKNLGRSVAVGGFCMSVVGTEMVAGMEAALAVAVSVSLGVFVACGVYACVQRGRAVAVNPNRNTEWTTVGDDDAQ